MLEAAVQGDGLGGGRADGGGESAGGGGLRKRWVAVELPPALLVGVGGAQKLHALQRHRGQCEVECFCRHHTAHSSWLESSLVFGVHATWVAGLGALAAPLPMADAAAAAQKWHGLQAQLLQCTPKCLSEGGNSMHIRRTRACE